MVGDGVGLEVERLTVRYGDQVALSEVSLEVPPGEVLGLAGPNGSGKSTLIRAVATELAQVRGEVRVLGRPLAGLRPIERARRVAWMPQEEPPGDNVPVSDYVEYGRYAHLARWSGSTPEDDRVIAKALEEVDLTAFANRGIHELSGGERQRARLARALAQDTPVLLLDEPTAHLDVGHQLEVLERVRSHARRHQRAVLVALHDLNLAARFTDRVAVLAHGRLRSVGPPEEVLSPELLAAIWGVVAELRQDPRSGLPYLIPQLPAPPLRPPPGRARPFRVHVVGGGGSGAGLLRAVMEHGWDLSAGVLPLFDTDSELARELGVPAAFELPFAPIGGEALGHLDALLELADAIVIAPFPVGPSNVANLEHLVPWASRRPILLIDPARGARWDYADGRGATARSRLIAAGATVVADSGAAIGWLAGRSASGPTPPAPPV